MHVDQDTFSSAKIYLLRVVRQQSFAVELDYLQFPHGKKYTRVSKKKNWISS